MIYGILRAKDLEILSQTSLVALTEAQSVMLDPTVYNTGCIKGGAKHTGGSPLEEMRRFLQDREFWYRCGEFRMRYVHVPAVVPTSPPLPAVVFVHGLLGYSFSWRHNLDSFSQQRDVYAVDLLGMGHSDRPETGQADFSLAAAASRLVEFLHALGPSQFDLVATSHGGAVAMLAASQDRASANLLIRRMVLVAPAHPFMTNARLRLAFFGTPIGRVTLYALGSFGGRFRGTLLRRLYAKGSRITPETLAGYAVNLNGSQSYSYALEVVRTWRPDMQQLRAVLQSIAEIPVLLLWGDEDRAVPAESAPLLQGIFRDAQYVLLPRVGHLPYEEAPEEFNRYVLQFLAS